MVSSVGYLPMVKLMLGLAEADNDRSIVEFAELELALGFALDGVVGTVLTVTLAATLEFTMPEFLGDWLGSVRWGEGSPSPSAVTRVSGDIGDEVKRGYLIISILLVVWL